MSPSVATTKPVPVVPVPMGETCRIIEGIRVCDREYVEDVYVCGNFADDFAQEAHECGLPTWNMDFGCSFRTYHRLLGYDTPDGHVINIIQVDYSLSTALVKYCLFEPQRNEVMKCWLQPPGAPVPPKSLMTWLQGKYPWYQKCIDDGWEPFREIYKPTVR